MRPKKDTTKTRTGLEATSVLAHLEALAQSLGINVRYERLEGEPAFSSGGLCRVNEKHFIIVNSEAGPADKIGTLVRSLKRFDLTDIYIKPALRDLLEGEGADET